MLKHLWGCPKQTAQAFSNQKGTSLIEVLVSIFIVLLIFQLTYIIAFSTSQTAQSRHNTSASLYAVSLIEAIRTEGTIDSGLYHIAADDNFLGIVSPEGMEAQVLVTPVEDNVFLAFIKVAVGWRERGQSHQLEIESIVRKDFD